MENNIQNNMPTEEENFLRKYKWLIIIGVLFLAAIIIVSLFLISQPNQPSVVMPQEKQAKITAPQDLSGKLYLATDKTEVALGEEFEVKILMATNNYDITAAAGFINYDQNLLELVAIKTAESSLTMGAEQKNENGVVSVVRGQPGDRDWTDSDDGYNGNGGILGTVVFKALAVGEAEINFIPDESRLVLDDGFGTSMAMSYKNIKIMINDK